MPDGRVAIHAALTAVMLWLGIILAAPGDTFGASPGFAVMAGMASESTWSLVFWLTGTIGALGLLTPNHKIKLASIFVVSTMHGVFAACLLIANPNTTGSGTYSILAALGYYLALRRSHSGFK